MERIKTGIKGLDEMLNGGLPKNKHVALSGGPGCGKTSFAFEFIYRGAQQGENGLYITLVETEDEIRKNIEEQFPQFSDMKQLMETKKIQIIKPEKLNLDDIIATIEKGIENNVKRVVVDSATIVRLSFSSDLEYRQTLFEFLSLLRNLDCTLVMTIETETAAKEHVKFDIEHFVMDGAINLYSIEQGERRIRALEVFKMRGTDHSRDIVPFKVTADGMKVYAGEKVF